MTEPDSLLNLREKEMMRPAKRAGGAKEVLRMRNSEISVMDFAIQAEADGAAFYSAAAELAGDGNTKSYLLALAAEEGRHADTFRKLKEKIARKGAADFFVNPEVDDYLDAVLRGGLFEAARQASSDPERPGTIEDAYRIAIRAERSSILLYEAMIGAAKDRVLKKALGTMVREERAHLVRVVSLRADRDNLFAIERFGCMC